MPTTTKKVKKAAARSTALAVVPSEARDVPSTAITEIEGKLPRELRVDFRNMFKAANSIYQTEHKASCEMLRSWYVLGTICAKHQRGSTAGDEATVILAAALSKAMRRNISALTLGQAAKVTRVYSWPALESLLKRAGKANISIAWNHISQGLATFKTASEAASRKKWENELIARGYSVEAFLAEIRHEREKKGTKKNVPGRGVAVPKSPGAACRQILKYRNEIAVRLTGWDSALFDYVEKAGPADCTDELVESLGETLTGVLEVLKTFSGVESRLKAAIARVEKVKARRAELAEADPKQKRKSAVVEEEEVEEEIDEPEIEVEVETAKAKPKPHETNGHGKPMSVAEKIARAKAKAAK